MTRESDTPSLENHYVSLLQPAFRAHADKIIFRSYLGRDDVWGEVTYRQLEKRLTLAQAHWKEKVASLSLQPLDVVGFWLTGRKLSDMINAIAVSSLGLTPQLFSGYFERASVILELLAVSGGKALVVDIDLQDHLQGHPMRIPTLTALEDRELETLESSANAQGYAEELRFGALVPVRLEDDAFLFHSSGTTGSHPKIIPYRFRMLQHQMKVTFPSIHIPLTTEGQTVANTLGRLANIGSFHCFVAAIYLGQCIVQASTMAVTPRELMGMVRACKLTTLILYAIYLAPLIKAAQEDDELKRTLQSLHQVIHTGFELNKAEEDWARANGIRTTTCYGTTETGQVLMSRIGPEPDARFLRPIPGCSVEFIPYSGLDVNSPDMQNAEGTQLYELVVPSGAGECPPQALCALDGSYHPKDLFERVGQDGWVYRGRAGDWIRCLGGFVDSKTIEDYVRTKCTDLVHDVVAVGSGRHVPCLIVETEPLDAVKRKEVATEIFKRIEGLNERLFPHERIEDARQVIIVDKGTLPRTKEKGNVRRAATEEAFKSEMDSIYADLL